MDFEPTHFEEEFCRKNAAFVRAWHAAERFQWLAQFVDGIGSPQMNLVLVDGKPTAITSEFSGEELKPTEVEAVIESRLLKLLRNNFTLSLNRARITLLGRDSAAEIESMDVSGGSLCQSFLLLTARLARRGILQSRRTVP